MLHLYNMYIATYSNATLCENFKALGEELKDIIKEQTEETFFYILIYIDERDRLDSGKLHFNFAFTQRTYLTRPRYFYQKNYYRN